MRYAALDPSTDGSAITIWEDGKLENMLLFSKVQKWEKKFPNHVVTVPKVSKGNEQERVERLEFVSEQIVDFILSNDIEYLCMEDYAYNAGKTASQVQLAEFGGILRKDLYKHVKIRTHDPLSVKLYWTDSGKATKWEMFESYIEEPVTCIDELLHDIVQTIHDDYYLKYFQKKPTKPTGHLMEGVVDSVALASLMETELKFRTGEILLNIMNESTVRVFNRVTKNIPYCLIDRPFLYKDNQ